MCLPEKKKNTTDKLIFTFYINIGSFFKKFRKNINFTENNDKLISEEYNDQPSYEGDIFKKYDDKLGYEVDISKEYNDQLSSEGDNDLLNPEEYNNQLNSKENNIRVVVGLDFGTTYSGFAYCHVSEEKNVCSNDNWHGEVGQLKTHTVLQYDADYNSVKSWGAPAVAKKQSRRTKKQNSSEGNRPVELFKLHLGDLLDEFKPKLPVDYKKAITDYLREIGKVLYPHNINFNNLLNLKF
jgi:hypothetical protein